MTDGTAGGHVITGHTTILAHVGYPTHTFKSPMIYNPWFEARGVDAVVVPMAVTAEDFAAAYAGLMRMRNLRGMLITMPHKVTVLSLADEVTPTARIAGAANAILRREDGTAVADMFDGAGFVRGMERKGRPARGASALVVGSGGVGSAIAASLAAAGVARLGTFDVNAGSAEALAARLREHYPALAASTGSRDPAGWDIVVNATPLGMNAGDPLPFDADRLAPATFVGEVVMKEEHTPLLRAAMARGCTVQVGTDMLFEMIPAYLEFFGFGTATAEELRGTARLRY
jgi:shikimate dehydrogenase